MFSVWGNDPKLWVSGVPWSQALRQGIHQLWTAVTQLYISQQPFSLYDSISREGEDVKLGVALDFFISILLTAKGLSGGDCVLYLSSLTVD